MSTVEWKTLGEVCDIGTGNNNREDAIIDGLYPFFVRSKEVFRINKYLFDEEAVIIPGEGGIGDIFHYINGKYGLHQRAYRIHPKASKYNCKYIYYYLAANFKQYIIQKSVSATVTSIRKPMLEGFSICVPSLEVQQAIVNQLDTFTTLISRLESELELRQKQYEHYREVLLNFEDDEEVEWKTLGEICTIVRGASPRPIQKYLTDGIEGVNWIKIGDVESDDKYVTRTKEKITIEGAKKSRFLQKGSFILSNSMSFGRPYILQIEGCIHDGWIAISNYEEWIIDIYLYEIIRSKSIQAFWELKANNGGAMSNLNSDIVKSTLIPIPSKQRQQQIVSQLDTFEQLITALKREIALRKKQYEYYREKLLTFDE